MRHYALRESARHRYLPGRRWSTTQYRKIKWTTNRYIPGRRRQHDSGHQGKHLDAKMVYTCSIMVDNKTLGRKLVDKLVDTGSTPGRQNDSGQTTGRQAGRHLENTCLQDSKDVFSHPARQSHAIRRCSCAGVRCPPLRTSQKERAVQHVVGRCPPLRPTF